jgi:hypothetical protein
MITKDQLFEQYDKKVDAILDVCDWKTNFTSEEVCGIVYKILEQNKITPSIPVEDFHTVYLEEVDKKENGSMFLSHPIWVDLSGCAYEHGTSNREGSVKLNNTRVFSG